MIRLARLAFALLAGAPLLVSADEPELEARSIENIIVTASREPHTAATLPASVDWFTAKDIRIQRPSAMLEMLRHRAGLHVDQPGGRGGRSSVYTRGLDPNHTVVMIDGIPLNDETNARGGSFDLSTLSPNDIERVEIIRGPASAVHGSAAIGGAINLIPRRGRDRTEAELEGTGGGSGYYRGRASLRGTAGPLDLSLGGTVVDEGDPNSSGDYRGGSFLTHLGLALTGDAEVRGTLRFSDVRTEAFPDFSGGKDHAINRDRERRDIEEISAGLRFEHDFSERFHYAVRTTVHRRREQREVPAVLSAPGTVEVPAEPNTRERYLRYALQVQGTLDLGENIDLTVGSDIYREDGHARGDLEDFGFLGNNLPGGADADIDRIVTSPFTEIHWETPIGITLLAGLRVDLPESRSEEFLPRVGASYRFTQTDTKLQASWGRGFKLPSFFALERPIVGNPDLRPERSNGFDVSIQQPLWTDRFRARLTYFDIDVAGLIDFNPTTFRLENLADATSRGGELEVQAVLHSTLTLAAHATYLDASGRAVGERRSTRLRNRPRWRGGIGATWSPTDRIEAHLQALFVGDSLDTSAPFEEDTVRLPGYHRLDIALAWQATEWASVFLAIDNLTDSDYEEVVGFPAIGIRPRAGVEIRL